MPHLSNYPPGVTGLEPEIVGYPETDIVVNTADESITDLANAVVVMDWAWNDDMDNDDAVLYATAHGKSIAALVAFVQKVASMETIDDVVLITEDQIVDAIRYLAVENKLVAEGAGAISLAAALNTPVEERGKTVCVLTGGSIDPEKLAKILK